MVVVREKSSPGNVQEAAPTEGLHTFSAERCARHRGGRADFFSNDWQQIQHPTTLPSHIYSTCILNVETFSLRSCTGHASVGERDAGLWPKLNGP